MKLQITIGIVVSSILASIATEDQRKLEDRINNKASSIAPKKFEKRTLFGFGYGSGGYFNGHGLGGYGIGADNAHVTHITITNEVGVPVPIHYPVVKRVPYPVKVPIHVPVDRPYPVHVAKPYPVPVEKPVPYPVVKHVPYPVKVPVKVPVVQTVPVPYPKPAPYPVYKHVPYPVKVPFVVEKKVPIYVKGHGHFEGYDGNRHGHHS